MVPQGVEDEFELPAGGRDNPDVAAAAVPDAVPDPAHERVFGQDLDGLDVPLRQPPEEILAVHEALDKLSLTDTRATQLVKLRYFAGYTMDEIAEILGIAPRTADDVWAYARAWLAAEIQST